MPKSNETSRAQILPSLSTKKLAGMIVGIWILSLLLGLLLTRTTLLAGFDRFFYELLYRIPHVSWLNSLVWVIDHNFLPIGRPHPSFMIVIYLIFLGALYLYNRKLIPYAILALVCYFVLARTVVLIDTFLVFRGRPFFVLPNEVTTAVRESLRSWTSFPSGHTRDAMTLAVIIGFFLPKSRPWIFTLPLFVGFSRIYLGLHYPTDVLSGLLLGWLNGKSALFLASSVSRFYRRVRGQGSR